MYCPVIMGKNSIISLSNTLFCSVLIQVSATLVRRHHLPTFPTFEAALDYSYDYAYDDEIFVCGGERLFDTALNSGVVDRIYLTMIWGGDKIQGNKFFNHPFNNNEYVLYDHSELFEADDQNEFPYQFLTVVNRKSLCKIQTGENFPF